jgi:hypothetical protein
MDLERLISFANDINEAQSIPDIDQDNLFEALSSGLWFVFQSLLVIYRIVSDTAIPEG